MGQVSVTIAGISYRIACETGEEEHMAHLAALFDGKIAGMRETFGEIGDLRLHVMAAITLADELVESRRRIEALEAGMKELRTLASTEDGRMVLAEARMAEGIARVAERIERLAKSLNAPASG